MSRAKDRDAGTAATVCPTCERPWAEHTKGLPGMAHICPPRRSPSAATRPLPRPSWALAWISQDWRRKRPVTTAYKLASAEDDDLTKRPSDEVFTAVSEARARLMAYVKALDSVLADWDVVL